MRSSATFAVKRISSKAIRRFISRSIRQVATRARRDILPRGMIETNACGLNGYPNKQYPDARAATIDDWIGRQAMLVVKSCGVVKYDFSSRSIVHG